jgi:hypothetical protein
MQLSLELPNPSLGMTYFRLKLGIARPRREPNALISECYVRNGEQVSDARI